MIKFDSNIAEYILNNKSQADKMFEKFEEYSVKSIELYDQAFELYKPIIKWFIDRELYKECIDYVKKNIPAGYRKHFLINNLNRKIKSPDLNFEFLNDQTEGK